MLKMSKNKKTIKCDPFATAHINLAMLELERLAEEQGMEAIIGFNEIKKKKTKSKN